MTKSDCRGRLSIVIDRAMLAARVVWPFATRMSGRPGGGARGCCCEEAVRVVREDLREMQDLRVRLEEAVDDLREAVSAVTAAQAEPGGKVARRGGGSQALPGQDCRQGTDRWAGIV